jgi:hypothetical protein
MNLPLPDVSIHSQFVIDFIEEINNDLDEELQELGNYKFNKEVSCGACLYRIENLLEIINPILEKDIKLLKKTYKKIEESKYNDE